MRLRLVQLITITNSDLQSLFSSSNISMDNDQSDYSDLHSIFSDYDNLMDNDNVSEDSDLHSIFSDYDKLVDHESVEDSEEERGEAEGDTEIELTDNVIESVEGSGMEETEGEAEEELADNELVEGSEVDGGEEVEGRKVRKATSSVWVCNANAAYSSLVDANALTVLVPSSDKSAKLSCLVNDGNSRLWSLHFCGMTMECSHATDPEISSFVFAGCSVLSFLGLYWSPVLSLLVCPEEGSVIPGALLWNYLQKRDIKDHPLDTLLCHLLSSFPAIAIEDDLECLYNQSLRSICVDRPIPGLKYDAFRTHYHCPECFKWYSNLSNHFSRCHSTSLRAHKSGENYFRQLSIMLDSSKPSFRIRLFIRAPNSNPKPRISVSSLDASSLESPTADSNMVKHWMSPDFRNPTGPAAPALLSGPVDGSYMFMAEGTNHHCLHLNCGWQSSDGLYTGCSVLSFFQCFYSPVLHAIVNPRKKRLLHSHSFMKHIQNRSQKYKSMADELHNHVTKAFDLSKVFTAEELYKKVHQDLILPAPILGLNSPKSQYWCPACNVSYTTPTYHVREYHPGMQATKKGVAKVDVIVLWVERELLRYTVRVTASAQPSPSPRKNVTTSFDEAPHLEESGINLLVKSWGQFDISTVLSLVVMPSEYMPSDEESQRESLASKSEAFLQAFHRATGSYLYAAQKLIQERHHIFRKALNGFNNERPEQLIHDVSDETLSACRSSSTRVLSLALRYTYKTLNQKNKSSPAPLGKLSLSPIMGIGMNQLIQELVRHLNKAKDIPGEKFIVQFLHKFLVISFTEKLLDSRKIASLWELSALMACMLEQNEAIAFKSANVTLNILSHAFRTGRSMLVHCAVAGSLVPSMLKYPFNNTEKSNTDSDAAIRFLEAQKRYLDPTGGDYLYGRLKVMSQHALQCRQKDPIVSKQHWSGSTLIFSWRFISDKHIEVQQLRSQVFSLARQHENIFMNLFPASFISQLQIIQVESFVDDERSDSIFTIPENTKILSPLVEKLTKCLEEEHITRSQVLQRSQDFLSSLLRIIYTTTGPPPRAFQVVDFHYATGGTTRRNFRIIDKSHGVFVGAKAVNSKTSPKTTPIDTIWLLTPQITRTLLVFLGVYRPVEAFYAAQLSKSNSERLLPLDTHIFCNPKRRRSIIWGADNVEQLLKESSPLQVEAYAHSLIMTQIISRFFKPLLEHLESTVLLDKQSQHATSTSRQHYAVERLQNVTGSQYNTWEKHLLLGQAIHSFFYLIPPIASLGTHRMNEYALHILVSDVTDVEDALYVARHVILSMYQLAALPAEKVSVKVRYLMHTLPFIYGNINEQQILAEVAQALKVESLNDADAHLRLLATAGVLLMIALSEWTTGELLPCSGRLIMSLEEWAPKIELLLSDLYHYKEQHPNAWNWILEKGEIWEGQGTQVDTGNEIVLDLMSI
ncbi:hypothetical protein APHAL10511_004976 [Amanita phalloides]|nr:hypothetical protein APHAL10511_004976 [Amanita phalloides]